MPRPDWGSIAGGEGDNGVWSAISSASQSMLRSTARWWDGRGCWERTFRVDLDEEEVFLSNSPFELRAPAWLVLFPWVTWGWHERLGCFTCPRPQNKNSCHFLSPSLGPFHYLYVCKSCSTDPWRTTEAPEGLFRVSGWMHCGEGSSPSPSSPREAPPSCFCYTASFSMRLNLIHRLTCHFLKTSLLYNYSVLSLFIEHFTIRLFHTFTGSPSWKLWLVHRGSRNSSSQFGASIRRCHSLK